MGLASSMVSQINLKARSVHNRTGQLMPIFLGAVVDQQFLLGRGRATSVSAFYFVGYATCSSRDDPNYIGAYPYSCPIAYESAKGNGRPHCATRDLVDAVVDGTHRLASRLT